MSDPTDIGCVCVSIRDEREFLVIDTPAGSVRVEIRVLTSKRARAVIRAPKCIAIRREKREVVPNDAV